MVNSIYTTSERCDNSLQKKAKFCTENTFNFPFGIRTLWIGFLYEQKSEQKLWDLTGPQVHSSCYRTDCPLREFGAVNRTFANCWGQWCFKVQSEQEQSSDGNHHQVKPHRFYSSNPFYKHKQVKHFTSDRRLKNTASVRRSVQHPLRLQENSVARVQQTHPISPCWLGSLHSDTFSLTQAF